MGFEETLGHPELIVFDVTNEVANGLLWRAFSELQAQTLVIEDRREWLDDGERIGAWRALHPRRIAEGWLTLAKMRRSKRGLAPDELKAFQLVLADEAGHLPWEDGYDERLRPLQPALWEPPED